MSTFQSKNERGLYKAFPFEGEENCKQFGAEGDG